jgi:hypothetical protein
MTAAIDGPAEVGLPRVDGDALADTQDKAPTVHNHFGPRSAEVEDQVAFPVGVGHHAPVKGVDARATKLAMRYSVRNIQLQTSRNP